MNLFITFLGTGTSTGVPMLACTCAVCSSTDQNNKRLRTSFLIQSDNSNILFDSGPDFRQQALNNNIKSIDSIIISHEHADHLHGLDDIRPFSYMNKIDVYTPQECASVIRTRFPYMFSTMKNYSSRPQIDLHEIDFNKRETISNVEFEFLSLPHGTINSIAAIFGNVAIISDCHEVPKDTLDIIKSRKIDTLIIDCLRDKDHRTHLTVKQSFEYIEQIAPKRAYLTHIGHELDHDKLQQKATQHFESIEVFVAYDGLKIQL